ncbi:hypothetical protein RV13_GL003836 [Enterococcus raffinosus]|nr:hypothetical protein RV13_GL003836 [Enterococcus raffinosus]
MFHPYYISLQNEAYFSNICFISIENYKKRESFQALKGLIFVIFL